MPRPDASLKVKGSTTESPSPCATSWQTNSADDESIVLSIFNPVASSDVQTSERGGSPRGRIMFSPRRSLACTTRLAASGCRFGITRTARTVASGSDSTRASSNGSAVTPISKGPLATQSAIADAVAISKLLKDLGFRVELLKDTDRTEFDQKWSAFLSSVQPGDVVAFYFAGHGIQVDGANYLLPRDTPGLDADESAILAKSLNFHELMEELEARRRCATTAIAFARNDDDTNVFCFAERERTHRYRDRFSARRLIDLSYRQKWSGSQS